MAIVKLYTNTAFNSVDIPESKDILSPSKLLIEYEDENIMSCEGLQYIIAHGITSYEANNMDYAYIIDNDGNDCLYTVLGTIPDADRQYKVLLEPNCLPILLDDMSIISASAKRMSVDDDDYTFYPNSEPFEISEPMKNTYGPMDARFADNEPSVISILETISAPAQTVPLANATAIEGGNKATQRVYGPTQQFTAQGGPEQEYTTGQAITITDTDNNVISQTVMSTMQPKLRPIVNTGLTINKLFEGSVTINTGTNYWINGVSSVINRLTADGADRNILNYWSVPTPYIGAAADSGYIASGASAGGVSAISNQVYNNTYNWTTAAGYHNKKVYYSQALTLTVFNPISGARLTKQLWEIRNEGETPASTTTPCDYSISADIRPDGCPIFAWKYDNGSEIKGFAETIEGGGWQRIPIAANTYSGSEWDRRALANQKAVLTMKSGESLQRGLEAATQNIQGGTPFEGNPVWEFLKRMGGGTGNAMADIANNTIGQIPGKAMPSVGSLIGGGLGLTNIGMQGLSYGQAIRALELQEKELNARASIAQPVLSISTSNYLRELGYNSFYGIVTSYSDNDLEAYDIFLTKYGYNVGNKAFTMSDFYSRPHFNYVQLNNIIIKSERSMWMREMAAQQLIRGVRIWHEYPSRGAIVNGNK